MTGSIAEAGATYATSASKPRSYPGVSGKILSPRYCKRGPRSPHWWNGEVHTVLRTAIGLTFILTLACAQAAEAPQSDNTIVNLSVVVLDNRGQPGNDLTAA